MVMDRYVALRPAELGLLMMGPRHGYEMHQELDRELGKVWHLGRSNLYAQLKALASAGWLTVDEEPQENRPARKLYQLTPAGREMFLAWLHRPTPRLRDVRLEFLTRLYFFQKLGLPGLESLVGRQKALLEKQVDALRELAAQAETPFARMVVQFRQGQLQAAIQWLNCCLEQ